jgi:hypothetical protein
MKYGIITITILLLLEGCNQPQVEDQTNNKIQIVQQTYIPPPPVKKMKLKEIDDTNFNADYMYPEDTKKKTKEESPVQTPAVTQDTMDKEECIAMITQEKFEKYAAIFGSEAASIKRCKMLKSTR